MESYLSHLKSVPELCQKFKSDTISSAFTEPTTKETLSKTTNFFYCFTPRYRYYWDIIRNIVDICDMFGIPVLERQKSEMVQRVMFLFHTNAIQDREDFEYYLDFISGIFSKIEKELIDKLQLLDEEEMMRLDEALNCYLLGCNYSAIVMSVSAIEFRLFSLMMSKCDNRRLGDLTLGQLIREYLNNKEKYGNVIPKKHAPLLEHCNIYRVFSVHPKRERITRPIATSIINMTFTFLLDRNLKQKAEAK
jgi:hypothetical protein